MSYPVVPEYITVHLGAPDAPAENVTVTFPRYIKGVAASEIYPTWNESAIRANVLAQISVALNRVYTEFYRSRGYDFDITNNTQYDQAFSPNKEMFENINAIVDDTFNNYIVRRGNVEPLYAQFCDGVRTQCRGLSQWGSQELAQQGYNSVQILRSYYGDIEIVTNAPVKNYTTSYPGNPIRRGNVGPYVVIIQTELNRISQNYPAIPKIPKIDGIFGEQTEASVRKFQEIFNLQADGIVGQATWYKLVRLYTAVTNLAELQSQGQTYYNIAWAGPTPIQQGDRGIRVEQLQYMLRVLSAYISDIPNIAIDGIFGPATRAAVLAAQRRFDLPQTGSVDYNTWEAIFNQFTGIEDTSLRDFERLPYTSAIVNSNSPRTRNTRTTDIAQFPGNSIAEGDRDNVQREANR